jgi:hypothetical protein
MVPSGARANAHVFAHQLLAWKPNTSINTPANANANSRVPLTMQATPVSGSTPQSAPSETSHWTATQASTGIPKQTFATASNRCAQRPTHGTVPHARVCATAALLEPQPTPSRKLVTLKHQWNGTKPVVSARSATHKPARISSSMAPTARCSGTPTAASASASPTRSVVRDLTSTTKSVLARESVHNNKDDQYLFSTICF